MIEVNICPACDGAKFNPFVSCMDHAVSHETFNIIQCTQCQLLITSPRPSKDAIGEYYFSPTYTSHIKTATSISDKIYLAVRNYTLKWKLALVKKNSVNAEKKILDVGCGTGEFLRAAKKKGWDTAGMEPSPHARAQAHLSISMDIKSSLEEIIKNEGKFGVITLWHVLEHVDDLNTSIETLKGLLTKTGTLFIAVPNPNSLDAQYYERHWAAYDVPRHLWHFSYKSMKTLLKKHGLTVKKVIPMWLDAFYISLLSEKYRNHNSFSLKGMINTALQGVRSNYQARRNKEYSSLIYVVTK